MGQTDQAIGAAGLRVLERYAGRRDPYGNDLQVTARAVADEIAGAADLAKAKLAGRPVAVVRGLADLVQPLGAPDGRAADLIRETSQDMFSRGAREAVLLAALVATGQAGRYEELVALDEPERTNRLLAGADLGAESRTLLRDLLAAELA
jgi:coenzyme F420-0:L-glutamate ligase/coenzyme F420-1:gamma-L-glutamate ligase